VDLSAGASVGVAYESNPLQIGNSTTPPSTPSGDDERDSFAKRLSANVAAATTGKGPIDLKLQAQYAHVEFASSDTLSHSDYSLDGSLDWNPVQLFDVSLQASERRVPVGLADIGGEQARQQTTRQTTGTFRLRPTPRWQVGLASGWQRSELPQPGGGNFQLRATSGSVSLDYLGAGPVIPGVIVSESRGSYSSIVNATRYEDQTVQGTLNYRVTDFSTFSLFAGHTQRTTTLVVPSSDPLALANEGDTPAFTGRLIYERQLSPKTSFNIGAFRSFQQYDAGVNTTVGTGFSGGVNWAPTTRLSATFDSQYTWSTISGAGFAGATGERKDLVRGYSLSVNYRATRRLSLRTYFTRTMRNSTVRSALFNGTTAGLDLTAGFD
jgi:hypothetical protein